MDFIFMLSHTVNSLSSLVKKLILILLIFFIIYIHNHLIVWFVLISSIFYILKKYREQDSFFIQDANFIFSLSDNVPFFYQLLSTITYIYIRIMVVIGSLAFFYFFHYTFWFNLFISILLTPFIFLINYLISQYLLVFLLNLKQGEKVFLKIIDLDKKLKGIIFYEDF